MPDSATEYTHVMRQYDSGRGRRKSARLRRMYIDFVPNRGSKPAILLRESIREGKRIRKRTIANLSALTLEQAEAIRLVLKGEQLAAASNASARCRMATWRRCAPPCGGSASRS
jgi:hypothetical protein